MPGQSGGGGSQQKAKIAKLTNAIMDKNREIIAKKKNSDARSKAAAKDNAKAPGAGWMTDDTGYARFQNLNYARLGKKTADKMWQRDLPNYNPVIEKKSKVQRASWD